MGNAVRVEWVDGPSSKQVEAVVSRFEAGSFDGSIDMYVGAAKDPSTPHRAKYVTCSREISPEISQAVRERIDAMLVDSSVPAWKQDQLRQDTTWRALQVADLRGGYSDVVVKNGTFQVVTKGA
jgi:molybdopterin synthase catalytic subunit